MGAAVQGIRHVAQHLFQRLAVLFVQPEQEEGEHGNHHDDGGGAASQAASEQKIKRNADERAAAEADELPLGQVEDDLGFDFRQVFGYGDVGHMNDFGQQEVYFIGFSKKWMVRDEAITKSLGFYQN